MNMFAPQSTVSFQQADTYQALKGQLHRSLIDLIEEEQAPVAEWSREVLRRYIEGKIDAYVAKNRLALNRRELEALTDDMMDEINGLGPIQSLIEDDEVNDILVNGYKKVFVERRGRLEATSVRFVDDRHVLRIIQRIVAPLGRRVDESNPMVDARLADGSRVNAIIAPLALDGPSVSIRKFRQDPLRAGDMLAYQTLSEDMLGFLQRAVRARCNILISGGTGSGKTTILNVLSQSIPTEERLVTIEDAAELQLGHPHVVRLETRPPNLEGKGEVAARDLVRNALRMRPDRIITGEVRGVEVMDMLQAMNTGHPGSMSTIHSNSPRDALHRLELLVGFAGFVGSSQVLRQWIAGSIELVVHVGRLSNGERKVISVSEIVGVADDKYLMQEIFSYDLPTRHFVQRIPQPRNPKLRWIMDKNGNNPVSVMEV